MLRHRCSTRQPRLAVSLDGIAVPREIVKPTFEWLEVLHQKGSAPTNERPNRVDYQPCDIPGYGQPR